VLVVDLDGEPLAPLRALEEILLCLGMWEDDDRQDPGTDTEPLRVPAPLAARAALTAVQRLLTALAHTQSRGPGCCRLLAPDGRYEHAPMTALTLPAADIDLLCATAAALGRPGLDADIAELVDAHAEQLPAATAGPSPPSWSRSLRGWPACSTSPPPTTPDTHHPAADHPARHRLRAQRRPGSRPRPRRRPHEPHLGARLRHRPLPVPTRAAAPERRAARKPAPFCGNTCNRPSGRRDGQRSPRRRTGHRRTDIARSWSAQSPQKVRKTSTTRR
jgi:hypothetical protein